ncbi:MAG: MMPL family transporter, partial [Chloroflexi bacterium]|nr:MMPL family transporter [Chloroflexota bacterium]
MKLNLSTQALARGSGRRPWITIGVWIAFLVLAFGLISTLLADGLTTEFGFTSNPESQRADTLLEERLRGPKKANEIVVVRSDTLTVDDPAFRAQVEGLYDEFNALGTDVIATGTHYYQNGDESLVSANRQTTILPITMAGMIDDAITNIEQVLDIAHEADGRDGFDVLVTGEATVAFETNKAAESDLLKGEAIGIPVALIILVILFGALLAALTPVVVALFSIILALGVTALIGQAFELSFFVTNMIFMIGLAVGTDYSLFIVSRYREERGKGLEKLDAITRAGGTATRAVFFSGMTVVLALFGMLIIPTTIFQSLAVGAILVVIASVLASLTLLPAVLSIMGDKIDSLRVPIIGRRFDKQAGDQSGGFWGWVTRTVMGRPVTSLIVSAGLLIAAAIPFFDMNTGFNGVSTLPDGFQSKEAFLILEKEFSFGLITPAEIVIDGDINSEPVQGAIKSLQLALEDDPAFIAAGQLVVNPARDLALLAVPMIGDPGGEIAINAIGRLRGQYIPSAFSQTQADVL